MFVRSVATVLESEAWTVQPDPSFTTLGGVQRWFLDGDIVSHVQVGSVDLAPADPRLPLLGIRRDGNGAPYPATFLHSPRTGEELRQPARGAREDFGRPFGTESGPPRGSGEARARLSRDDEREIALHPGRASLFAAGIPSRLYALHENLATLEWYDEAARAWRIVGRLPFGDGIGRPDDLPDHARAIVTRFDGAAFATGAAILFLPLPQLGGEVALVRAARPGLRFLGPPILTGSGATAPATLGGRLVVATAALPAASPSGTITPECQDVKDAPADLPPDLFFSPAMRDRVGVTHWCGGTGAVVLDPGSGSVRFQPWRAGFEPILAQPPYRDRYDVFHQLGTFEGSYCFAQVGGALLQQVPGPHLAAGSRVFWASETSDSLDGRERENFTMPAGEGRSLVVPLLPLGPDTLVALVGVDGTVRSFIGGEALPSTVVARLFHHQRLNGLHDLRTSLELRSVHDLAAFHRDGCAHVHSRIDNRCVVLPLSS